jgi:PHS family inorganic phosphate transporter-like MFS transporter
MGIGIGGDYPLSAVISSEFASTRTRGRVMTAVFSFQGWGQSRLVVLPNNIVARLLRRSIFSCCSRFAHCSARVQASDH